DTNRYVDRDSMLDDILETQNIYSNHILILYSDLADFRYLYLNYIKRSLQSLNEIVLMLPYYDSVIDIVNNLRSTGIDIDKYKKEGSIIIVQSEKAHYSLNQEFVGVMIMTKMLLRRLDKLGKAGISIISDMGLFFHTNKLEDLTKCETELMSSVNNTKLKVWCCYNKSDFDMLIEHEMRQNLLKAHDHKVINIF
ncbi:MAG TPA: MEDS domain-containing protein, partial [Nitrososphaeraceae archaeon]|nr:MEDS domain-containing protein [Nitrososphaeraceae archaeon]